MSCFSFLKTLFCGSSRRKSGGVKSSDHKKVKIRVGFDGKDTLVDPTKLNLRTTFGNYAVLLEYHSNKIIPLDREGKAGEHLDSRKRYVVVLNTHGSSQKHWDGLRGGKHKKHKHSKKKSSKKSKSKKDKKEKKEGKEGKEGEREEEKEQSGDTPLSVMVSSCSVEAFTNKDFAIASTQALLTANSTPNNGDDFF